MSDAPERVWVTQKWAQIFDLAEEPDANEYIRADISEAAIAAARAESERIGMARAANIAEQFWASSPGTREELSSDANYRIRDAIRAAMDAKP